MPDEFDEGGFRDARPSVDQIARDRAQAELAERLFGTPSEPHRLGRFVILATLGRGGMGTVYSAYDPALDRRVALKLLRSRPGRDAEPMRARLQREAQALARLSHPNVVPAYDVGIIDGEVFIVMEFVVGQTLRAWARDRPWYDVVAMYAQAARGLAAAHRVGLVHRDVKPDNIMVGKDDRPRVLDFGLVRDAAAALDARPAQGGAPAEPAAAAANPEALGELDTLHAAAATSHAEGDLTVTNALLGTLAYMAPEQLTNASVGPAADQFSFCVALYEALYGELPFPARDASGLLVELRAARARGRIGDVQKALPDPIAPPALSPVPRELWTVLRRGLARDPADRWPGMDALVEALASTLGGFDRALTDPVAQRIPQVVFRFLAGLMVLLLPVGAWLNASRRGGAPISLRSATMVHIGFIVVFSTLFLHAWRRWRRIKQLHGLLGAYSLSAVGMVVHDLVGLHLGRTFYQTMLAILPMLIVMFVFASLVYARWMAWIAVLFTVCLILFLAIPSHYILWPASTTAVGWIIVLRVWRRLTRRHGGAVQSARTPSS